MMDLEKLPDLNTTEDPVFFEFMIGSQGTPQGRVFGPKEKRNWVMWKLSDYTLEAENRGIVSVARYINGKWEPADDWRNLSN